MVTLIMDGSRIDRHFGHLGHFGHVATFPLVSAIAMIFLGGLSGGERRPALPPEAFGLFEDRNDPFFHKRLTVTATAVAYTVRGRGAGMGAGRPHLVCRGEVPGGVRATMQLDLDCAGTTIPFQFRFRLFQKDWILTEEDTEPMIFTREQAGD
jgi:hypothetical protein